MQLLFSISILLLYSFRTSAQNKELPPEGSLYHINKECVYERQKGKLDIKKDPINKLTSFETDSLKMTVSDDYGAAWFLSDNQMIWEAEYKEIYIPLDSITSLLFQNGLLTPDLLVSVFNKELNYIDHKGDTSVRVNHTDARSMQVNSITQKVYLRKSKTRIARKELRLSISVEFEGHLGSPIVFYLELSGRKKPSPYSLKKFLETATIKCFRYSGFEI